MKNPSSPLAFGALAILLATTAWAHVTIDPREARIGGSYRAALRVSHGCGGSATVRIRVSIPEGVIGVKPMPKQGWQIELVRGKYDRPYETYHGAVGEGVKEIAWSGGRLPDEHFDEFVFSAYLSEELGAGRRLHFPVVQECETGMHRWIEMPQDGKPPSHHGEPAPGVTLLPRR